MLSIIGTVPEPDVPVLQGPVDLTGHQIVVDGRRFPVHRGTPALIAAAIQVCHTLNQTPPIAYLVGDVGLGHGSRVLYEHLAAHIHRKACDVMTFHYLQPDVDWHNRVLFAVQDMTPAPVLIADAGFMYAAKMSGQAGTYDLFTPDLGELAFLADEEAPHPFYTRGFILHMEGRASEMITRAYASQNAAKWLLVKGKQDHVANQEGILATVDSPRVPFLEPIGGTGDLLTGISAALVDWGMDIKTAAVTAAKINRLAGYAAHPSPATQVSELIDHIPLALMQVLKK